MRYKEPFAKGSIFFLSHIFPARYKEKKWGLHMKTFLSISIFLLTFGSLQAKTADYIVVGMGASGAGIAKILSDNKKVSVIGFEAGANHDNDEEIRNATYAPMLEEDYFPQYFYQLEQIMQKNAPETMFNYTTGRLLGGGSSINGMQYVQGSIPLYEEWEALLGSDWSANKIRNTFKKLERFNGITNDPDSRGYKGPVDIRQAPLNPTTMAFKFCDAVEEATGHPRIIDYNAPNTPMGPFSQWQLFQNPNGTRESSSTAYLYHKRSNLTILDKTTVLKVLFKGKKAVGVAYLQNGKYGVAYARKKVILAAGVYSPWLLQLSGIGPKDVLEAAGIDVIYDNPNVGKNLVNHFVSMAMFTANPNDQGLPDNDPNALYTGGAFLPDPTKPVSPLRRGVQLIGMSAGTGNFMIASIALQPKSVGTVMVQSGDPLQAPLVDDGAFTDPRDLETYKNIYKVYIKDIAKALNEIDSSYELVMPTVDMIDDDEALEEYITSTIEHTHHWAGTCRMAPRDQGGVVDTHGNVYGVKHLVIADDTIAPIIPDGNTAACAFMIGRKLAKEATSPH